MTSGFLSILKIEIDGHFHGGEPPKPWVAEITGADPRYGLAREFVQPMNDWSQARVAMSGNIYGRVAHFALRDGRLYEVSRTRGNPSKRRVVREFIAVQGGKLEQLDPEEVLARVGEPGDAVLLRLPEDTSGRSWIARVRGLGTPERLAWIVRGKERLYRLPVGGVYEIVEDGRRRFTGVQVDGWVDLTEREAWAWLTESARSA